MARSILIAGATGNTGRSTTETLSKLLQSLPSSSPLHNHRILALTRSATSPAAQYLARLPSVTVLEQNWTEITPSWLQEHNVVRAFIAPHNKPTQFADESTFHLSLHDAGVKYVVRISTTAAHVRPDSIAYYPRAHWAIETLLASPEFEDLHWTSLQPNVFQIFFFSAAQFIKEYRETGKLGTLRVMGSKDTPVAVIDSDEVGVVAAHLLSQDVTTRHNKKKYVLNGPESITGQGIVRLVEETIGVPVPDENVSYQDQSGLDDLLEAEYMGPGISRNVVLSTKRAVEKAWAGGFPTIPTSKVVLDIAAPRRTPREMLDGLLQG
ncbi:NmrA-like family protein [Aspergillus germanicus]